jgi:DNA polymerase (family 10)
MANVTHEDVAEVLLRVAAILELADDNPYRVLAYRRAARQILSTQQPLHELLTPRGRLNLPGLGTSLRRKLGELVSTGRLRFGIEMTARLPEAATGLMAIPTIGPRTARRLHEELGVTTLEEVVAVAQAGRIRNLPGFGLRKEQLILQGALELLAGHVRPVAQLPQRTVDMPVLPLGATTQPNQNGTIQIQLPEAA